ncbi:MAG TPA: YkgJ family cysteine cluster protein [Bryobacteraceae bacterium]|nr:YkgJ family cysteine cluster protein [Bryobacteraceae bacterium]
MTDHAELVQIVDRTMAEAVRKGGSWIACRIGCHECCIGPFPITQLDAVRLREGLTELKTREPERAARVLHRAHVYVDHLTAAFPDNPLEAALTVDEAAENEFCPALDPATGACDLYAARPITCRTFGPAVRFPGEPAARVCELCFHGATDDEIIACSVEIDTAPEAGGETIVAFALAGGCEAMH